MEKFKAVVSTVDIPDKIAIDVLQNIMYVHSKFHHDLYRNLASPLQDAIARSHNFIKMEEDTKAIQSKQNAASSKPSPTKKQRYPIRATTTLQRSSFQQEEELTLRRSTTMHYQHQQWFSGTKGGTTGTTNQVKNLRMTGRLVQQRRRSSATTTKSRDTTIVSADISTKRYWNPGGKALSKSSHQKLNRRGRRTGLRIRRSQAPEHLRTVLWPRLAPQVI